MLGLLALVSHLSFAPLDTINTAVDLLGGKTRLEKLQKIKADFVRHYYLVEQSERSEGPYYASYASGNETTDFSGSLQADLSYSGIVYGGQPFKTKLNQSLAKSESPQFPSEGRYAFHRVLLSPEKLLLRAGEAKDLRPAGSETIFGNACQGFSFTAYGKPVWLFINNNTGFPIAAEVQEQGEGFFSIWGKVTTRYVFGAYAVTNDGVVTPTQWIQFRNGYRTMETTYLNPATESGDGASTALTWPVSTPPRTGEQMLKAYRKVDVAPGIVQYAGPFNTAVFEQKDGLVVMEAPLGSALTTAFLDQLKSQYPGKRISAVCLTTDSWPHFGGLRSFAARAAQKIVCLDQNADLVSRLLEADYSGQPDEWEKQKRRFRLTAVKEVTTLGSGDDTLLVAPIRGANTERMLLAYKPSTRVLYASDTIQMMGPGKFFAPQMLFEVREAVKRYKWQPETVFALHAKPMPWKDIVESLDKLRK